MKKNKMFLCLVLCSLMLSGCSLGMNSLSQDNNSSENKEPTNSSVDSTVQTSDSTIQSNSLVITSEENKHLVTFKSCDDDDSETKYEYKDKFDSFPAVMYVGHTLVGWYYDSEYTKKVYSNDLITCDLTVYAKWTEDKSTKAKQIFEDMKQEISKIDYYNEKLYIFFFNDNNVPYGLSTDSDYFGLKTGSILTSLVFGDNKFNATSSSSINQYITFHEGATAKTYTYGSNGYSFYKKNTEILPANVIKAVNDFAVKMMEGYIAIDYDYDDSTYYLTLKKGGKTVNAIYDYQTKEVRFDETASHTRFLLCYSTTSHYAEKPSTYYTD